MQQYAKLSKTLHDISIFIEKQQNIFNKQLVLFIRPQLYEFEGMIELHNLIGRYRKAFIESDKRLAVKKDGLFKAKNIEKWKLDPQILKTVGKEALLNNKSLALANMLPKETEDARKVYICFTYYANRMRDEIMRIYSQKEEGFKKHVEKLFKKESEILDEVML